MTQFESDRKNKNQAPDEPASLTVDSISPAPKSPGLSTDSVSTPASATADKTKPSSDTAPDTFSSTLSEQQHHAALRFSEELDSKPTKKKDEEIAAIQSSISQNSGEGKSVSDSKAPVLEKALLRNATSTLQDQEAIINKLLQPAPILDKLDKKIVAENNIDKKSIESVGSIGSSKVQSDINSRAPEKTINPVPSGGEKIKTFEPVNGANVIPENGLKSQKSSSPVPESVSEKFDIKAIPGKLDSTIYKNDASGKPTFSTIADQISTQAQDIKHGEPGKAFKPGSEYVGSNEGVLKSVIEEKSKSMVSPAFEGSRYKVEPASDGNMMISKGFKPEPNILKNDGGFGRPENFSGGSIDYSYGKTLPKAFAENDQAALKAAKYASLQQDLGERGVQAKSMSFDSNLRQLDHQSLEAFSKPNLAYQKQIDATPPTFKDPSFSKLETLKGGAASEASRGQDFSGGFGKADIKQYPTESKPFPVESLTSKFDYKQHIESGGSMVGNAKFVEQAINGKPAEMGALKQINMIPSGGSDVNVAERGANKIGAGGPIEDRISSKLLGDLNKTDLKPMISDRNQSGFENLKDLKTYAPPSGKLGQEGFIDQGQKIIDKSMPGSGSLADKLASIEGGMKTQPSLPQDIRSALVKNGEPSKAGEPGSIKGDGFSKPIDSLGRSPNTTVTPDGKQPAASDGVANRGSTPGPDGVVRPADRATPPLIDSPVRNPATSSDIRPPAADGLRPAAPADVSKPGATETVKPGAGDVKPGAPSAGDVRPGVTVARPENVQPGSMAPGVRPVEVQRGTVPNATTGDAAARTRGAEVGGDVTTKPSAPGKDGTVGRPVQDAGSRPSDAAAGKIPATASPIKLASALDPVSAFEQSSQRIRQLAENRAGDSVGKNPFESRNPFETKLSGLISRDFGTESGAKLLDAGRTSSVRADVGDTRQIAADGLHGTVRNTSLGNVEAGRRSAADGPAVFAGKDQPLTSFEPNGKNTSVRVDQSGKELTGKIDVTTSGAAAGIGRIPLSGSVRVADFQPGGREVGQSPIGTGDIRTAGDIVRVPGMRGFGQVGDGRTAAVQGDIRTPRGETNRYITGLELALILSIAGIAKLRGDARNTGARLEGRTWSITRQDGKPLIYVDGRQNPFQVQRSFGKGDGSFRIMVSAKGDAAAKLSTRTMRSAEISSKSQTTDTSRGLNLGLLGRLTYLNSLGKTGPMNYYGQFKSTSYTGGMGLAFVMAASGMTRGSMMPSDIQAGDKLTSNLSGPADRIKPMQANSLITQFGRFNLDATAGNSSGDTRKDDDAEDASQAALDDYQDFLARLDGFKREEDEDDESVIVNRAIRFGTEALFEEASAEDEEVVGEVEEDDTKNGALSQVLRRPKWVIEAGQTLDGIAEKLFGSADVGWLIADLNRNLLRETYIDNKRIVELHSRQEIELPVYQDIQKFNQARKKTWNAENLITIVVERQIDREAVDNVLRRVVGAEA